MLSTDPEMHGFINRADVAQLAFRALRDPRTIRGAYAAVDQDAAQCVNPIIPVILEPPGA